VADPSLLDAAIAATLSSPRASLCEVVVDVAQTFAPKLASRKLDDGTMVSPELDDMHPFLPRDELAANRLGRT
jgi:acetolactate synthase-1/2/3 large subunit